MKGNVTVEASYVFPFSFLMIGIVCFLGIFLYNQTVLKLTAYECILQTIQEGQEELTVLDWEKICVQQGQQRTLGLKDLQASVKTTVSKITVSYTATQSFLQIPLQVTSVYEKTFPEVMLRLTKGNIGEEYERNIEKGIE